MTSSVVEKFGNRIRVRACGLCYRGDDLLLINHKGLYSHDFWAPPGGGLEVGESTQNALKREFLEECGLEISVGEFLFACEFINPPLHAVELFFEVFSNDKPRLGHDPEMGTHQVLTDLSFWPPKELAALPSAHRHGIFKIDTEPANVRQLRGFYPIT
jgi:8-oxo-dGTP diphosphatase